MNIKEARTAAGLSRAAMCRQFEIPVRTAEDWESRKSSPPIYVEKLLIKELLRIAANKDE